METYAFRSVKIAGIVIAAMATKFGTQCKLETTTGTLPYRVTLLNIPKTELGKINYFIAGILFAMQEE